MEPRKLTNIAACIFLVFVAGLFTIALVGCKDQKDTSGVVGFPQSFADLAEKVKPAVVNISTVTTVRIPGSPFKHFFGPEEQGPSGDFFRHFFGDIPDRDLKQQSLGSGFIIDKDGYIITNNHVVEGADEIKVKLADGREFKARVVGRDQKTDLALIKISSLFKNLPTLALGDSDKIRTGDWVLAFGNPFGLEHTVTQGIISATGRVIGAGPYDNFLQTDAPINPGNSGGPLVNLRGEVIGINSAIIASGQGIGFAIPSNIAQKVVSQLKEKGKVTRGWIGISIQSVTREVAQALGLKEARGALVGDVVPNGPAASAGIKRGDIVVAFDGKEVRSASDLPMMVAETLVGKTVSIKLIRDGKEMEVKVTVAEMTGERLASQTPSQSSLGMSVDDVKPQWRKHFRLGETTGVVVVDVAAGSPADDAGIQPGDVIKEVNRASIGNVKDYREALRKPGKGAFLFLIKRNSQTFYVSIRTQ